MPVIKFKPFRSPQILDAKTVQRQESTKQTVHRSKSAVLRSRELIKQSKEVVAISRKRRKG